MHSSSESHTADKPSSSSSVPLPTKKLTYSEVARLSQADGHSTSSTAVVVKAPTLVWTASSTGKSEPKRMTYREYLQSKPAAATDTRSVDVSAFEGMVPLQRVNDVYIVTKTAKRKQKSQQNGNSDTKAAGCEDSEGDQAELDEDWVLLTNDDMDDAAHASSAVPSSHSTDANATDEFSSESWGQWFTRKLTLQP